MTTTRMISETEGSGALDRVLSWLGWVPRLVGLHLVWVFSAALPGGAAPATTTLLSFLRSSELWHLSRASRWHWFREHFLRDWWSSTLKLGPFLLIATAAAIDLVAVFLGRAPNWFIPWGLSTVLLLGGWSTLAFPHAAALTVLRPQASVSQLWLAALAGPVIMPMTTFAWCVTVCCVLAISLVALPIGLTMGVGLLLITTWLLPLKRWEVRLQVVNTKDTC